MSGLRRMVLSRHGVFSQTMSGNSMRAFAPMSWRFLMSFCAIMPTCFTVTRRREGSIVPNLFRVGGYLVFFWSNENGEPIHVHIIRGKPSPNATKVWLTRSGQCIVANNRSRIPQNDLNELLDVISAQFFLICRKWKEHFCVDDITFFC